MNLSENQDLDVDALMGQIRAEIAGRTRGEPVRIQASSEADPDSADGPRVFTGEHVTLSRLSESAGVILRKDTYEIRDFFNYHDEEFIRNAYRGLLGREPDVEGAKRFLDRLRSGDFAKADILGRIRFSPEGRAAGVRVAGLIVPFALRTLRRIPIVGHALGIVQYILRLPNIVRAHERLEATVFLHQSEMRRGVNAIDAEIEAALQGLHHSTAGSLNAIERKIAALDKAISASVEQGQQELEAVADRLAAKVERPELATLEKLMHSESDMHRRQVALQLETLEQRLCLQVDAQIAQETSAATKMSAELAALRSLVGALEQWTGEQPSAAILRETIEFAATTKANSARIAGELAALRVHNERIDSDLVRARSDAVRINTRLTAVRYHLLAYRQSLLEQERRLGALLENLGNQPETLGDRARVAVLEERDHLLDGFYATFEDTFRGTRKDIKQRVEIYLPYLRDAGVGTIEAPILDIGCGRGELLELLRENGFAASGVDLNRITAEYCREKGLTVEMADGLAYLQKLNTDSLGAVMAIHVIEHMPFRQMMALFDEVRRVLKPGGLAIFETPNPENLIVASCNFWYDPTHLKPLPSELVRFILDNRGFTRLETLLLHPRHERPSAEAQNDLLSAIADRFYGPQDYAVLAYKS